ncbi:8673_t:CDS:2 [Entrophospora sp. SA101]|nr:8673_t:CDS:2 [Entrophospora sp. SA101]
MTGFSSHKEVSKSSNRILRLYYSNNKFLFFVCALNESFFVSLYLLSKISNSNLTFAIYLLTMASFPVCVTKQIINIIQLIGASRNLANVDLEDRRKKAIKNKD